MGLAEQIDQLLADFQERQVPKVTPRSLVLPGLPGKADVVVGMRRSGKSYFLYQDIQEKLRSGVDRERILYLNLEDERLLPLDVQELRLIPEAFYRRCPANKDRPCWFYFDEIQNVPGWEVFVRRMIDSENVSVVLSGSSAKLLGREIATSMRGRSLSSELLPFSFRESLLHAGIDVPSRWPPASRQKALFENRFDQYLEHGGFPEVQGLPRELRIRILQDYVDAVLFRDVAERHRVENLPALRYLQHALLSRPAGKFSIHRLHNDLKSLGVRVGKDSLYSYLKHLEDAFLLFTTEISSASLRVRQSNPRKCYPVDHGLAAAISFKASGDQGHLLENAVYLELRRRGWSACYVSTRSGFEVDFLAENRIGERQLIQVCAELSDPGTRRRELRALAEAMDELTIAAATVVTLRDEDTLDLEPGQVRIIPAWRWFLQGSER